MSRSASALSSSGATATHGESRADAGHGPTDVRVAGIRKGYGGASALDGIDLDVRGGELVALLGPSGSGKTTLLRVIAGLEVQDEGSVFFGDEEMTGRPVRERGIGFVFQHYALFRHLTVFDNIAYGLRARRHGRPARAEIRRRVLDLLDLVQLAGLDRRFPSQLSGGQRQRVALARALATEPRVLLLDEPFGALDARVRKDLRRWLREIHARTGQTTIFVTHDQDEALELADRVAIIDRGRLEQIGPPDEIYDEPASAFVMSFVGESLRLPVEVASGVVTAAGRRLSIPVAAHPDGAGELFLRPGDLALSDPGHGDLPARVCGIRRVGRQRRAEVRLDLDGIACEVDLGPHGAAVGDRIVLTVTGGRFFDPNTGRARGGSDARRDEEDSCRKGPLVVGPGFSAE